MVSAVAVRPVIPQLIASAAGNADGFKPADLATPKPNLVAKSDTGGGPSKGPITTTPQLIQLVNKNPALRQVPYANYANFIKSTGKIPQPAHPGAAYFQVLNGPQAGSIVDISKEKYLGKFMSSATKIDLMEYGFGRLGLKKIGNVTADQFAKANTYYREVTASGSNSGAVQRALKDFGALGDKAFPNGPPEKKVASPPKAIKFDDLHPFLQGEVRSGRMELDEAVRITQAEAVRRQTMHPASLDDSGVTCVRETEIRDRRVDLKNGNTEIYTEAKVSVRAYGRNVAGSLGRLTVDAKIYDPRNQRKVADIDAIVVGIAKSKITVPTDVAAGLPNPRVVTRGQCHMINGTLEGVERNPPNPVVENRPGWTLRPRP